MFLEPPPVEPVWLSQPSAQDIRAAQALYIWDNTQAGSASALCYVLADGRLDACRGGDLVGGARGSFEALKHLASKFRLDRSRWSGPVVNIRADFAKLYDAKPTVLKAADPPPLSASLTEPVTITLLCTSTDKGLLENCAAAQPNPKTAALEAAAVSSASDYRLKPATLRGQAAAAPYALRVTFGSRRISRPNWLTKPTADKMADAYPERAQRAGIGGAVVMHCRVNTDGRASDCEVESESPPAFGFGAAALKLASEFRMAPQTVNGEPVANGEVTIPINFAMLGGAAGNTLGRLLSWLPLAQAPTLAEVQAAAAGVTDATFQQVSFACSLERTGALHNCLWDASGGSSPLERAARTLLPQFKADMTPFASMAVYDLIVPVTVSFSGRTLHPESPRYVRRLDWLRSPSEKDVLSAYPPQAVAAGSLSGAATLDCGIIAGGRLDGCRVVKEEPAAQGFGDAASRVATIMQANPWTRDGEPALGARVRLPFRFIYSGDEKATPIKSQ